MYFVYKQDTATVGAGDNKVFEAEVEGNEAELKTETEEPEGVEVEVKEEKAKPGIAKKIIPIERISAIYAYGRISFTSGVISYLSKYGTAVHFYNQYATEPHDKLFARAFGT